MFMISGVTFAPLQLVTSEKKSPVPRCSDTWEALSNFRVPGNQGYYYVCVKAKVNCATALQLPWLALIITIFMVKVVP